MINDRNVGGGILLYILIVNSKPRLRLSKRTKMNEWISHFVPNLLCRWKDWKQIYKQKVQPNMHNALYWLKVFSGELGAPTDSNIRDRHHVISLELVRIGWLEYHSCESSLQILKVGLNYWASKHKVARSSPTPTKLLLLGHWARTLTLNYSKWWSIVIVSGFE